MNGIQNRRTGMSRFGYKSRQLSKNQSIRCVRKCSYPLRPPCVEPLYTVFFYNKIEYTAGNQDGWKRNKSMLQKRYKSWRGEAKERRKGTKANGTPESEELQEPRNKTASWAKESKSQDGSSSQGKGGGNRLRPFVRERSKAEDLMANSSPERGSSSPSIHPSNPRKRL